jgi:hypothetical protein
MEAEMNRKQQIYIPFFSLIFFFIFLFGAGGNPEKWAGATFPFAGIPVSQVNTAGFLPASTWNFSDIKNQPAENPLRSEAFTSDHLFTASRAIDAPTQDYWSLTGNYGILPGTNVLGTLDGVSMTLVVSGTAALVIEPTGDSPNIIGGHEDNRVTDGVTGATISGGGSDQGYLRENRVTDNFGTIGGGYGNQAGNDNATVDDADFATVGGGVGNDALSSRDTVAGGIYNEASGGESTVGGGAGNTANSTGATVSGGKSNTASGYISNVDGGSNNIASGWIATVGGGDANEASGSVATVPGGRHNTASGDYSLAAGHHAKALHTGTFVWADSTNEDFSSTGVDQFLVRASGGAAFTTNGAGLTVDGQPLWGAANDGPGSGLDADTLDGEQGSFYQARVTGTCSTGSAIQTIGSDGSVTCESTGSGGSYTAGTGLDLVSNEFSIQEGYRLPQTCDLDEIAMWDGYTWICTQDRVTGVYGGGIGHGGETYENSFWVGSLPYSGNNTYEKLMVKIWGGSWYNTANGEDTFVFSTRGGLKVTRTRLYGATDHYTLRIYDNSNTSQYDFVIHVHANFPNVVFRSFRLDGNNGYSEQSILPNYDVSGFTEVFPDEYQNILTTDNNGYIGIGEISPQVPLHVTSQLPYLRFEDLGGGSPWDIGVYGEGNMFRIEEVNPSGPDYTRMVIKQGGNVGLGTSDPNEDLDIRSGTPYIRYDDTDAEGSTIWETGVWGKYWDFDFVIQEIDNGTIYRRFIIEEGGDVGIGTTSPREKLDVNGAVRAELIKITGGDLAEPFSVNGRPEPGMVVSIDPENPGQLRIADTAHDRMVAGCVSGANDLQPGVILYQDSLGDGETFPVALSGRVYCWADATYGAIQPGDLLTTSDSPGHVMAVSDYTQAQGAIIGKAMTNLEEGQGLVLVLVSLQ